MSRRTVCRRAERLTVELSQQECESVGAPAIRYLNRLSDLLFVMSRHVNDKGDGDVLLGAGGGTRRVSGGD